MCLPIILKHPFTLLYATLRYSLIRYDTLDKIYDTIRYDTIRYTLLYYTLRATLYYCIMLKQKLVNCALTFQGLHSVRLWIATILKTRSFMACMD
jgi:hypothetical protein